MSEGIRLFVDDVRACPPGWELARTVKTRSLNVRYFLHNCYLLFVTLRGRLLAGIEATALGRGRHAQNRFSRRRRLSRGIPSQVAI